MPAILLPKPFRAKTGEGSKRSYDIYIVVGLHRCRLCKACAKIAVIWYSTILAVAALFRQLQDPGDAFSISAGVLINACWLPAAYSTDTMRSAAYFTFYIPLLSLQAKAFT